MNSDSICEPTFKILRKIDADWKDAHCNYCELIYQCHLTVRFFSFWRFPVKMQKYEGIRKGAKVNGHFAMISYRPLSSNPKWASWARVFRKKADYQVHSKRGETRRSFYTPFYRLLWWPGTFAALFETVHFHQDEILISWGRDFIILTKFWVGIFRFSSGLVLDFGF